MLYSAYKWEALSINSGLFDKPVTFSQVVVSSLFNHDFLGNKPVGHEYLQKVKAVLQIGNPDFY